MVIHCCVPFCENRQDNKERTKKDVSQNKRKISFHCFPRDPILRNLWLHNLNINTSLSAGARICSDHFEEEYFEKLTVRARLKPDALPKCIQEEHGTNTSSLLNVTTTKTEADLSDDSISITDTIREVEEDEEEEEDLPIDPSIQNCNTIDYNQYKIKNAIQNCLPILRKTKTNIDGSTTQPSTSTRSRAIMHSGISPEECKLRQKIMFLKKHYRHKIRNLQQNLRRKTKQLAKLKYTLSQVKKGDQC